MASLVEANFFLNSVKKPKYLGSAGFFGVHYCKSFRFAEKTIFRDFADETASLSFSACYYVTFGVRIHLLMLRYVKRIHSILGQLRR